MSDNTLNDEFQGEDIDANDVDWKATAETLQLRVNELNDQLTSLSTYPYQDNDITHLAPNVSVTRDGSLLNYDGVNYVPQAAVNPHPSLKEYSIGEYVQVEKNGDWLPGRISGIQKGVNVLIYVDTERGPRTVAGPLLIRKIAS